jgi:glycosyltransferase involved in cell wall biosynthesis
MGKKSKKANSKQNKKIDSLPFVSICTPTFNRRPFFKGLVQCIAEQDYEHSKIEWVVVDDGTDSVRDILESDEVKEKLKGITIQYYYEAEKMDLGQKRNYMHKRCTYHNTNDIIVYMDDDDFYPPERVSHSVKKLMANPNVLCGGASELYLWFNTLDKMYKFGPYGPNHATAGTFAFKKKLLDHTSYEDSAVLAEEKHFLKNYTVPFVQFDTHKTILVVSHEQNTFDKKKLLHSNNKFVKESPLRVKNFIQNPELMQFYHHDINELLKDYTPGDVKNKPKVLAEIKRRDEERKQMQDNKPSGIIVTKDGDSTPHELTIKEVKAYMSHKTQESLFLKNKLEELMKENERLKKVIESHTALKTEVS